MSERAQIAIALIDHAPFNPRKISQDDPRTIELAASIKAVGLINPISVRPVRDRYQVIAGARRLEAAAMAGLSSIDVTIHELNDHEALKITVTENLQRADLKPVEEGRGIAALLESGRTVEEIALDIGKSQTWVRRRARLATLTEDWQHKLEDVLAHFTAADLILVAQFPPNTQNNILDRVLQSGPDWINHRRLKSIISEVMSYIAESPWKGKGCHTCEKRSDMDPDLFAGVEGYSNGKPSNDARCLDPECWAKKCNDFQQGLIKKIKKEIGREPVLVGHPNQNEDAVPEWRIDKCAKEHPLAVPATMIEGETAGEVFYIIDPKKPDEQPDREPVVIEPSLEQHRRLHMYSELAKWISDREDTPPGLMDPMTLLRAVATVGLCAVPGYEPEAKIEFFKNKNDSGVINEVWKELKGTIGDEFIDRQITSINDNEEAEEWNLFKLAIEICGLELQDFIDAAHKAFPDPKKSKKKGGSK